MVETADVVVIGGGVNGASIAYHLTTLGVRRVTLVERRALAAGATGRSSALVRMHYTNEWDARLAWESFRTFTHWGEIVGGDCGFVRTGFVVVVAPEYADHLRRNVEMLRGIGINTMALTPPELKDLQPYAEVEDIGAAAYEPESGYASPVETTVGFARRAREAGASVRQWTEVTRIDIDGGRVRGVETSGGRIEAPVVVVAAGAWAPRLCLEAGLKLPVRVKAIHTAVVRRPPPLREPHLTYIDNPQGTYFRPEGQDLTIVGVPCSLWDIDPNGYSEALPSEAAEEGARILIRRIPGMAQATMHKGYQAIDGYSDDRHAILDRVPGIDSLYLATGFSGTGFKVAPAVGKCLAELITRGKAETVDIRAFRLSRFAENAPLVGQYEYAAKAGLRV